MESLVQVIHFYQLSGVVWLHSKSCSIISSYLVPSGILGNVSLLSTQYLQMMNFQGLFTVIEENNLFTGNLPSMSLYKIISIFFYELKAEPVLRQTSSSQLSIQPADVDFSQVQLTHLLVLKY